MLILGGVIYFIRKSGLVALLGFSSNQQGTSPTFQIVSGTGFQLETSPGMPFPAIDPAGDLIPVIGPESGNSKSLTIWSLSRNQAVLEAVSNGLSVSYLPLWKMFYRDKTNDVILPLDLPVDYLPDSWRKYATILVVDLSNGAVKQKILVHRLARVRDLSPSGRYLLGLRQSWAGTGWHSLLEPVTIDLTSGETRSHPISVSDCYFEDDQTLVGVRPDAIFRYHIQSQESDPEAILKFSGDEIPECQIDFSWKTSDNHTLFAFLNSWRRMNYCFGRKGAASIDDDGSILSVDLDGRSQVRYETWEGCVLPDPPLTESHYTGNITHNEGAVAFDPLSRKLTIPGRDSSQNARFALYKRGLTTSANTFTGLKREGCLVLDLDAKTFRFVPSTLSGGSSIRSCRYLRPGLVWAGDGYKGQFIHLNNPTGMESKP